MSLFRRACFKSLNWPLNQKALSGSTWNIFTKKEHFDELTELLKESPFNLRLNDIGEHLGIIGVTVPVPAKVCDQGVLLLEGLKRGIRFSLENGLKMLFAPPDTIFGDGTIPNLIAAGNSHFSCVCVSHPRVLPSILDEIDEIGATRGSISNSKLVTLSMKHPHDSWTMSESGAKDNRSLMSGVTWKKIDHALYQVQHRLPTHYYCGFNKEDWDFWWGVSSFGAYDHRWPGEQLIRQERQRYIGSSDACFIAEVTDYDKNIPPLVDKSKMPANLPDDTFMLNDRLHSEINRQTVVYFRGE